MTARIVIVGSIYPYRGGIPHYTAQLAGYLSQEHTVRVHSFKQLYPKWLFPGRSQLEPGGPPLIHVPTDYWLIPWWPPSWGRSRRDWALNKPDLIIFQWWVTFMAPMTAWLVQKARQSKIPVVAICHNVLPHEPRAPDGLLARLALDPMDRLVVHSHEDEQVARSLFPSKDIRVVPFPQYSALRSDAWSRERARAALQIEERLILFFGFVRPYKGLSDLIMAMPAVLQDGEARLLVVGEIWKSGEPYFQMVKQLNLDSHIRFMDRYVSNDEVAMYFAAADLVVLPYRRATGSAVAQLAFALGTPVVATRTGSMAQAVEDGETGFLVEPGDVTGLAEAIRRFFREDRADSFRGAIASRRQQFSWAAVADCALQLAADKHAAA